MSSRAAVRAAAHPDDLRLLGFAPRIPVAALSKSFRVMWFGFWLNLITGLMLFAAHHVAGETLAVVSLVVWVAAITAGRFMAYV